MNKITHYLNQHLVGSVYDKTSILDAYSTDRSIIRIKPRFVAIPENTNDVRKLLRFSNQLNKRNYNFPVAVRGSGLDKTGADLTTGMVISTEKLTKIQEIDPKEKLVRVQAGVTLEQLNSALALYNLTIPVDSNPKETIGGLIAGCSVDDYAGKYGGIYNFIDRVEFILPSGDCVQTEKMNKHALKRKKGDNSVESTVYRGIDNLIDNHFDVIEKDIRSLTNSSGYPTISLVKEKRTFDLLPLLFASQGTLGVITEVILRAEVISPARRMIATFSGIRTAMDFLIYAQKFNPLKINLYDARIIGAVEEYGKKPSLITRKLSEEGFVVFVSFNDKKNLTNRKLKKCAAVLPRSSSYVMEDEENEEAFDGFEGALLSYLNDTSKGERTSLVDGFYLPARELQDFLTDLRDLEKSAKQELPIYGSFATKNYNVRPDLLINQVEGRQFTLQFLKDFNSILKDHDGILTSGTPEGMTKALVTNMNTPKNLRKLYDEIKTVFDPNGYMNPNVKLGADVRTTIRHLRTSYNSGVITK